MNLAEKPRSKYGEICRILASFEQPQGSS